MEGYEIIALVGFLIWLAYQAGKASESEEPYWDSGKCAMVYPPKKKK